jgi:hypothetical protein
MLEGSDPSRSGTRANGSANEGLLAGVSETVGVTLEVT